MTYLRPVHEVSICRGLVQVVLDEMAKRAIPAGTLRQVRVVAGQMHQIVPDALTFAYEALTRDTPAVGSHLELRVLPLSARCTVCGWRGSVEPPLFMCGSCQSGAITLEGGEELYVEELEVAEP